MAMMEAFAEKGAKCVITDINEEAVQKATDGLKAKGTDAIGIVCDVTNEESVEKLFQQVREKYGRLDIAVLNAGILKDGLLIRFNANTGLIKGKMSLEQWQSVVNVNLTGVFLTGREAACHMTECGNGGVIIPISSVSMHGNPGQTNYSACKAGVAAMTKLWSTELAKFKIRVAGIAPGFIATEMVLKGMNQKALAFVQDKIPIGRLGNPSEIAQTAVFITENELVCGVTLEISGGIRIG